MSRWSRLEWGCHRHDILPCMPATCPYRDRAACGDRSPGCGKPCPIETDEARRLAAAYDIEFHKARGVLGDDTYDELLGDMMILRLRLDRLSQRESLLDRHPEKALQDPDWYLAEAERLHRYYVMALNKWDSIRLRLREASADPLIGWIDLYRVQYVLHGIGPACELATGEVSLENVGAFDYSASDHEPRLQRWPYSDDPDWRYR